MVSRENRIVLSFAGIALAAVVAASELTAVGDPALLAILLCLGVVAPQLVNNYLDHRRSG